MKEEFKIVSRYDNENILYKSSNYQYFIGNSWNEFVLFCLQKKFNLSNANLFNADLSNADLFNADLSYANLFNANLFNADLSYADLFNANLFNADLSNADLSNAKLSIFSKWAITYYKNPENKIIVKIGCKEKTIKDWDFFFSDKCTEKFDTERNTIEFLRIKAEYKAVRTYLKTLGKNLYNFNKNEVV